MDYDHLSPTGSRSPLASSNSSCLDPNPAPTEAHGYSSLRPTRACEYCRLHKVRCDIDPRDPSRPCGRCLKASRDCVSTDHSRKRRKTTDSRVLELEKKVERLTSRLDVLEQKGDAGAGGGDGNKKVELEHGPASGESKSTPREPLTLLVHPPAVTKKDVIDLGILDVELAGRIFQHFVTEFTPTFPGVAFPPNTSSSDIRRQKPTLFLAILAAASGAFDTTLQRTLREELLENFCDQILRRGVKSLDILQALTVSVLWYYPPENIGGNNVGQYIHMAASIATDIAITRSSARRVWPGAGAEAAAKIGQDLTENFPAGASWRFILWGANPDSSLPECRRALLCCYFLCENMSRLLRRPSMFPFTRYMAECVEFFETSNEPGVLSSDREFTEWVNILRISEEFGTALGSSWTRGETNMSEVRKQAILEEFLERTRRWRQKTQTAGLMTPALGLYYQCITKHMYDLVLHSEHIMDDFRGFRPNVFETLVTNQPETGTPQHTDFYIDSLRMCLSSVHSSLDTFLELPSTFASSLPALFYIEMGYAIGLLAKILFTVILSKPASRILKVPQVKFGDYIERLIPFLVTIMEQSKRYTAERLRYILAGLKSWVDKNKQRVIELFALSNKGSASEQPSTTTTFVPASPMPQTFTPLSQPGTNATPQAFGNYPDANPEEGGFPGLGFQDIDFGDQMIWDNFPLSEFMQLDGVQDVYLPWG